MPTITPDLHKPLTLGVITIVTIIWFGLLGYRDLVDPDEGRYAEISREMVASGDWITPRLNDLKYFEKPALQYWMSAISLKLFGINNTAARLWVALIAFLGSLWTWYLGKRLFGEPAGFYAFLTLSSGFMYVVMGHLNTLDMSVSVFLFFGIGALLLAQRQRENPQANRNWMLFGWAALALAVLSKGLIGLVLPGIALVFYSLWQRDWRLWSQLHLGKGLLLFFAITVPWFVLVSRANPEFARFFFIHEHFERFTTEQHGRNEAWWYFLPILLLGVAPWFWLGLRSLFRPGFAWRARSGGEFEPERFLWVYIIGIMLFFSIGSSKLPPYILPIFPALSLLMGQRLARQPGLPAELVTFGLTLLILVYGAFQVTAFRDYESAPALLAYRNWIIAAVVIMLAGGVAAVVLRKRKHHAIIVISVSVLLAFQILLWGFQTQSRHRSSHELATTIQTYLKNLPDVPIYTVGYFPHSLPFYLQRHVTLVEYQGELEMGIRQEPEKWLADWDEFAERWRAAPQAIAVFDMKSYPGHYRKQMEKLPMKIIYQDTLKLAVAKQ